MRPWFVRSLVAMVVVLGWTSGVLPDALNVSPRRAYLDVGGRSIAIPEPAADAERVLPPVPVTTAGNHAFWRATVDGDPVGYDPCRPVRYVVRPDGAPPAGPQLAREAVAIVSGATGLSFVDAGSTDEEPTADRDVLQPERYGPGWAPVLIAWAEETTEHALAGPVAGLGGSAVVPAARGSGRFLAAGRVVLDSADLTLALEEPDGGDRARAIIVHELAHVVGLDHVDDPAELMYPETGARTELGPGDLAGLAALGQVACETDLP